MAKYQRIVTTEAGLELLAAAYAGGTVTFTAIKTGSGNYTGTEDLAKQTALKSVRQAFGITSVTRTDAQVKLRSVLSNDELTDGYGITEIGVYAKEATGTEVLFAIIVSEIGFEDYLPPFTDSPTSITMELYLALVGAGDVTFVAEAVPGTYVTPEEFVEHTSNAVAHVTAAERTTWNGKLGASGNASNTTVAFTEASTLAKPTTGSTLAVIFGIVTKAIGSLISHLADTVLHITAAERTAWNDANSKKHEHSNKATLDSITAAYTTAEQTKLSGIAAGAQVNTITGVKGNSETSYRTGNVNLTAANVGAAASSHNQAASTITAGTFAGEVKANATAMATLTNYQVRNIAAGTADITAGVTTLAAGTIYIVYE